MRYTFVVSVCLIHTFLYSVWCWYACLAYFVPLVWLSSLQCIFACLPTCSCMSLCVVHIPIQWNYGHSIQTYICPPKTPSLFDNTFICPFICLACFVCPRLALFVSVFFACSYFFPCFFLYLFTGLFLLSLHVHIWSEDTRSEGTTS